jgi:hypothetical protein
MRRCLGTPPSRRRAHATRRRADQRLPHRPSRRAARPDDRSQVRILPGATKKAPGDGGFPFRRGLPRTRRVATQGATSAVPADAEPSCSRKAGHEQNPARPANGPGAHARKSDLRRSRKSLGVVRPSRVRIPPLRLTQEPLVQAVSVRLSESRRAPRARHVRQRRSGLPVTNWTTTSAVTLTGPGCGPAPRSAGGRAGSRATRCVAGATTPRSGRCGRDPRRAAIGAGTEVWLVSCLSGSGSADAPSAVARLAGLA